MSVRSLESLGLGLSSSSMGLFRRAELARREDDGVMGDADVIKPLQPFHFLRTLAVKLSLLADRVLCLG